MLKLQDMRAAAAALALLAGAEARGGAWQHGSGRPDPGQVELFVEQQAASIDGHATYHVGVEFDSANVRDVYALFGEENDPLILPPAFQAAAPFGSDVGPVRASPKPITSHAAR